MLLTHGSGKCLVAKLPTLDICLEVCPLQCHTDFSDNVVIRPKGVSLVKIALFLIKSLFERGGGGCKIACTHVT